MTGFRSISLSWSPSAATSAENRAATLQNSIDVQRSACGAGSAAARCSLQSTHQPVRFCCIEGRQGVHHVRQGLDVHAAEPEHHDRTELLVVDHAEQHLDALRLDHRRDQHARADAAGQIRDRRRVSVVSSWMSSRTPSRSDL